MKNGATAKHRKLQDRTIETRAKILEAAIDEFARHGYEGASTRSIAVAAEVQSNLLAYHFGTKEGLWRAAVSALNERFKAMYEARLMVLADVDDTRRLRVIMEGFIQFAARNPSFHWIMSHEASHASERLDWLVDNYVADFFATMTQLIRKAQLKGDFIKGDPSHLLYLFIGVTTRLYMLSAEVERIMSARIHDPKFIAQHTRTCLNMFFVKQTGRDRAH